MYRIFISVVLFLAPVYAIAQQMKPTGDDLQRAYEGVIADQNQQSVMLRAQILADQRKIEELTKQVDEKARGGTAVAK